MVKENLKIESSIDSLHKIEDAIDKITRSAGISKESYGKVLIATLEAVNNAILHGNKGDRKKIVEVEVLCKTSGIVVKVTDEGKGFEPGSIPDPTRPENILAVNGRGVYLMKKLADKIKFNEAGNSVEMTFNTAEKCNAELL